MFFVFFPLLLTIKSNMYDSFLNKYAGFVMCYNHRDLYFFFFFPHRHQKRANKGFGTLPQTSHSNSALHPLKPLGPLEAKDSLRTSWADRQRGQQEKLQTEEIRKAREGLSLSIFSHLLRGFNIK